MHCSTGCVTHDCAPLPMCPDSTWPTPSRKKVSLSLVANPSLNYPQISTPMVCTFCSNFVPQLGGVGHCFAWQGTRPTGGLVVSVCQHIIYWNKFQNLLFFGRCF